jgi:hypothetical protein
LSDDDLGPLYDLLIDEPPMIRRAIGELVYDHLIAQNIKTSSGARGTCLLKDCTMLPCLVTVLLSSSAIDYSNEFQTGTMNPLRFTLVECCKS